MSVKFSSSRRSNKAFIYGGCSHFVLLSLSLARRVISPCVCVWSQRTLIDIVASGVAAAERAGEREYNILSIVCVFVRCAREYISIKIMRERRRRRTANM
jgi:hypothetical protein